MNFPESLKYTEDHEWTLLEEDGLVVIGITDFAQKELGDIVFVEIETESEELEAGAIFGTIEAVKTVSDLFMPMAGTVEEVNPELDGSPELVNSAPYEGGWLIKIKPNDPADLDQLMTVEAYKSHIGEAS